MFLYCDEGVRSPPTADEHVEGLCGNAAACSGRVLRQLLRSRSAGLGDELLGCESLSPKADQVAVRPQQHFSPRPKRSADPERVESMKLTLGRGYPPRMPKTSPADHSVIQSAPNQQ